MTLDLQAEAKRLWQESTLTLEEIGKVVGRHASTVARWGSTFEWGPRPGAEGQPPRQANFSWRRADQQMAKRIHRIIIRKLDLMEEGLEAGTLSAEDAEQESKSIASMIGGYGKVREAPNGKKERKRGKAVAGVVDDVARLHLEIIERLERIERRRNAARGSE
jgi:hypothetical protein